MNWEAMGATGEVIGAVGVIISILYLAVQVRSNTRSLKASTFQAACDASARISLALGSDPQVALVWQKGLAGVQELSPAEVSQFQYWRPGVSFRSHCFSRVTAETLRCLRCHSGLTEWSQASSKARPEPRASAPISAVMAASRGRVSPWTKYP